MSMFKLFEAEDILPSLSRSGSERSSSSTGDSVMSKSLHAAPSRLEGVNSLWQDLDYLDNESDPPLWDFDISQKMSDLVIGKKLHAPEQLAMTDTINPYAPLFNTAQTHNSSLQLNSTTASEMPGSSNPRFKTEICRNFKEKGTCLYGDLCQFAHGKHELRVSIVALRFRSLGHVSEISKPLLKFIVPTLRTCMSQRSRSFKFIAHCLFSCCISAGN